jgi:hypothetical protein
MPISPQKKQPEGSKVRAFFDFIGGRKLNDEELALKLKKDEEKKERAHQAEEAKKRKKEAKKEAKSDRYETIYKDRLIRMEEALKDIKDYLPAADDYRKWLESAIQAGKDVLTKDKLAFAEAYKAMHSHSYHLETVVEDAEKAYNGSVSSNRKKYPEVDKKLEQVGKAIEDAADLLTAKQCEGYHEKLRDYERELSKGSPPDDIVRDLDGLRGEVIKAAGRAEERRELATASDLLGKNLLAQAGTLLSVDEAAPTANKLSAAAALIADRDFDAAIAVFEQVLPDLESRVKRSKELVDRFKDRRKEIASLKEGIETCRQSLGDGTKGTIRFPEAAEELSQLNAGLTEVEKAFPTGGPQSERAMSYERAFNVLDQTAKDLNAVTARIDQRKKFFAKAEDADLQVQIKFEEAQERLEDFRLTANVWEDQSTGKLVGADYVVGQFANRLNAIKEAWDKNYPNAFDESGLNTTATLKQIDAVVAEIPADSDTDGLAKLFGGTTLQQAQETCKNSLDALKAAIDKLAGYDVDAVTDFRKKLAVLANTGKSTSPKTLDDCRHDADALTDEVGQAVNQQDEDLKKARAGAKSLVDGVTKQLEALKKNIKGISDNEKRDAYEKLYQTFNTQLHTQMAILDTTQLVLINEVEEELEKLKGDIEGTEVEFTSALSSLFKRPSGMTYDDLKKKIEKQKKRLEGTDIKTFAGDTAYKLYERLLAVENEMGGDTMANLAKSVEDIKVELDDLVKTVEEDKKEFNVFAKEVEKARKLLNDDRFAHVPKVKAATGALLDGIKNDAKHEGGLANATDELKKAIEKINADMNSPKNNAGIPQAFADGERDLTKTEEEREKKKMLWAGNVDVLRKRIDKRSDDVEKAEKKGLLNRLDDADKAFKKDGDYDAAWAKYVAIRDRLDLVEQNPEGLHITARNHLSEVCARWQDAVGTLKREIDELIDKLKKNDDPELPKHIKVIEDGLNDVKLLFNLGAFDKPIAKMVSKTVDDAARSAARETALHEVRRIRGVLNDDPRIMVLARKILGTDMRATIAEVSLALADLETNMLISL